MQSTNPTLRPSDISSRKSRCGGRVFVSSHWAMELYGRKTGNGDFRGMCHWLRDLGIHDIEAGTSHLPSTVSTLIEAPEVLALERGLGSNFLVHNAFPLPDERFVLNLASPDKATRQASIESANKSIEACLACSAPFYSIHCGFLSDPRSWNSSHGFSFMPTDRESPSEGAGRLLDSLHEIRGKFPDEPRILLENSPGTPGKFRSLLFPDPLDLADFIFNAGIAKLGILLDLGHLQISSATLRSMPEDILNALLPQAGCLHVSLNDGVTDLHRSPGESSWFMRSLKQFFCGGETMAAKRHGLPVVLEFKFDSPSFLVESVKFWENFLEPGSAVKK